MSNEPETPSRPRSAVAAALCVYVESLAADARVLLLGDATSGLAEGLLDLGARSVHVLDPEANRAGRAASAAPRGIAVRPLTPEAFELRDAAFDLAIVSDLSAVPDASAAVGRLRRVVDPRGAVVALTRARTESREEGGDEPARFAEAGPAPLDYAELYDLFAMRFEHVAMTGVLPFTGVVFAELGAGEDVAVSVDTRLADAQAPGVFVVVASRERRDLDPYAIVQVPKALERPRDAGAEAAFAQMQLRAELLAAQLDEARARLSSAEARGGDSAARLSRLADEREAEISRLQAAYAEREGTLARLTLERDAVAVRASELETVIVQVQQTMLLLERRLASAEQGILERDDVIARLNAELDTRAADEGAASTGAERTVEPEVLAELVARAERSEAALAQHVAEVAHAAEAHAADTDALEDQLRERARVIAELEKEVLRREQLVHELVAAVEELRGGNRSAFEPAAMPAGEPEEVLRLRHKLDELAGEVARRESELVAQGWRIQELETPVLAPPPPAEPIPTTEQVPGADAGRAAQLERELARAQDELDALRQALTQEHAARVAAESGEELARARAELARQSTLLEQMGAKLTTAGADEVGG